LSSSPKKSGQQWTETGQPIPRGIPEEKVDPQEKNWVSWGWDEHDRKADETWMRSTFFFSVTLCLVGVSFLLAYAPDNMKRDWAQREGFLELRRREAAGLLPIDPNYVDPSKINLPSDEELGDTEIII
jgi:NADH dehydrogenase (ubiquinone) 1 beta subcomplex subunit 11